MKPSLQFIQISRRGEGRTSTRRGSSLPKIDYQFQASSIDFSRGGGRNGKSKPSFRGISANYFNSEARSHFVVEAVLFSIIVLTAAVPVIDGVRGLAQFVYGIL
jgi:hypothetical protein